MRAQVGPATMIRHVRYQHQEEKQTEGGVAHVISSDLLFIWD
jgi:hypothetical protein